MVWSIFYYTYNTTVFFEHQIITPKQRKCVTGMAYKLYREMENIIHDIDIQDEMVFSHVQSLHRNDETSKRVFTGIVFCVEEIEIERWAG